MRALVIAIGLLAIGCKKDEKVENKPSTTAPTTTTDKDGVRKVAVDVTPERYNPDRIPGKPGEKLILVFTRHEESDCTAQVRTADGKTYTLPVDKPVEVPVTVPQEGQVKFACGMDMITGVIVAEKG